MLLNYGIDGVGSPNPFTLAPPLGSESVVEKSRKNAVSPKTWPRVVRYRVEVDDHEGETVAVATILTMVKKRDQGPDAL